MTSATRTRLMLLVACMSLTILASDSVSSMQARRPNPVLVFMGQELYETGGKSFMRYKYAVENHEAYPDALFAPAPDLPPCGTNTKASRTWLDFFDQSGRRLYGFCALQNSADLNKIWFALESDVVPPSWVYIEMMDRQTNTKYKSNLTETTY
jgi:hypothetical protein